MVYPSASVSQSAWEYLDSKQVINALTHTRQEIICTNMKLRKSHTLRACPIIRIILSLDISTSWLVTVPIAGDYDLSVESEGGNDVVMELYGPQRDEAVVVGWHWRLLFASCFCAKNCSQWCFFNRSQLFTNLSQGLVIVTMTTVLPFIPHQTQTAQDHAPKLLLLNETINIFSHIKACMVK